MGVRSHLSAMPPFGYVNGIHFARKRRVFQGSALPHPAQLLEGSGKSMRHVKLKPGTAANGVALTRLIETAYAHIKARGEHG